MAHYAFINDNNIVTQVIVGRDEDEVVDGISDWEAYYGERMGQRCLRTSYNTVGNQHTEGGTPFRGNYAGIGFSYDEENDVFIPAKPFPSWILTDSYVWESPVPYPDDDGLYTWNENQQNWEAVTVAPE
jgi:hypothetical protein